MSFDDIRDAGYHHRNAPWTYMTVVGNESMELPMTSDSNIQ